MEVKGVGQRLPRTEAEPKETSRFEEVFDESKKKLEEGPAPGAGLGLGAREVLAELESLRSPFIDNNPLFTSLKEWMTAFRKELLEKEDKLGDKGSVDQVPDYELRLTLYDCVKRLLKEIVRTSDRTLQMNYLQRAYDWFLKRRVERRPSLHRELALPFEKAVAPSASPPKYVPEPVTRKLYDEKMRTLHPELPPPRDRLSRYKYKGLRMESEAARGTTTATPEKTEPIQIPSPPLIPMKVGIGGGDWAQRQLKPASIAAKSTFLYYEPQTAEEQKMERMWVAKKNQEIAEKRTAEEQEQVVKEWGGAKGRLNESLLRKHENANYGNNFGIRQYRPERRRHLPRIVPQVDSAYKELYDQDSSGPEEQDVSPTHTSPVSKSVEKPRYRKAPVIADLRTSTDSLAPLNKSFQDPTRVIYEKDKHKVDYVRKMYGHLINATDDKMDIQSCAVTQSARVSTNIANARGKAGDSAANIFVSGPKGTKTLSLYNNYADRPYTSSYRGRKPTRSVPATHNKNREEYRVQQMHEITRIKEHLAREDVPCSITALQRAVLIPEDYPAAQMTAENFPRPGSRLLVNPFAVKKKKKGKKSKKKGK